MVAILGLSHPGDGVLSAQLLGDHRADNVDLVLRRNRNKDIAVFDAGFYEIFVVRTVSCDSRYIYFVDDVF